MQNLNALLERLLKNHIDFVLVGGFASTVHGSTLVTQDLDICLAMTPEEIEKLRVALSDLHPVLRMNPNFQPSFLDHPKALQGVRNIYLKTDLGILGVMSELGYKKYTCDFTQSSPLSPEPSHHNIPP